MSNDSTGYSLKIARSFLKDLRKLPRQDQLRVRRILGEIEADPHKGRKVTAVEKGQRRWRVGGYRIRYDIIGREIQVLWVLKREDAYRRK